MWAGPVISSERCVRCLGIVVESEALAHIALWSAHQVVLPGSLTVAVQAIQVQFGVPEGGDPVSLFEGEGHVPPDTWAAGVDSQALVVL